MTKNKSLDTPKYLKLIQFADDKSVWLAETNDPYWKKKMIYIGAILIPPTENDRSVYVVPDQCVSILKKRQVFTDEQRVKQAEHMRRINAERLERMRLRKQQSSDE